MQRTTRTKLTDFDKRERQLTEKIGKLKWALWHDQGDRRQNQAELERASLELARLPAEIDYPAVVKLARKEVSDPREDREVKLRFWEYIYHSIRRDPELLAAIDGVAREHAAFTYSIHGVSPTGFQMMQMWQRLDDPKDAAAVYNAYVEQSAQLRPLVLKVVRKVNEATRRYSKELGYEVKSFADVLVARNDLESPANAERQIARLLDLSKRPVSTFIDQVRRSIPRGFKITVLNDKNVFNSLMSQSGVFEMYPNRPGALDFLRDVLTAAGFGRYIDLRGFGDAHPYKVSLDPRDTAPEAEGSIYLGKGAEGYAAVVNPYVNQDNRTRTKVLLHETGHILHYGGMNRVQTDPFFQYDFEGFREGMALFMDSLIADPRALQMMCGASGQDLANLYALAQFLELYPIREMALRGLFELALYSLPEDQLDRHYERLLKQHNVLDTYGFLSGIRLHTSGSLWATEAALVGQPGSSFEYAVGHAIANTVGATIIDAGQKGTAIHPGTAQVLYDTCYTGYEVPLQDRLRNLSRIR